MTLDQLGFAALVLCLPLTIVAILAAVRANATPGTRFAIGAVLVLWFGFTWTTRVPGIGPLPGAFFTIMVPVLVGTAWITLSATGRALLREVDVTPLVTLHVTRWAGGMFLLLHAEGRLSNPFAFYAGWGDILAAMTAMPAAWAAYRRVPGWPAWVLAWNVVGTADFLLAIFFGVTSQPGLPFQLFFEPPGAAVLTETPWRFIPAFYVPLFLVVHAAIFAKLIPELRRSPAKRDANLARARRSGRRRRSEPSDSEPRSRSGSMQQELQVSRMRSHITRGSIGGSPRG
jgi:hypothetical protein